MRSFRHILAPAMLFLVAAAVATSALPQGSPFARAVPSCNVPLTYRVGDIDPRFGLTANELHRLVAEAAALWQAETEHILFRPAQDAALQIHLQYDERQNRWEARQQAERELREVQERYESLRDAHDLRRRQLEEQLAGYEARAAGYALRVNNYNLRVRQWNRGELPQTHELRQLLDQEADVLQAWRHELQDRAAAIEAERLRVNRLVEQIRSALDELNQQVAYLNSNFAADGGYHKALYTLERRGRVERHTITVYQFQDRQDLRQVLAHELGHALGIPHVDDPAALMHYRVTEQNSGLLRLTEADRQALRLACGDRIGSIESAPLFWR